MMEKVVQFALASTSEKREECFSVLVNLLANRFAREDSTS